MIANVRYVLFLSRLLCICHSVVATPLVFDNRISALKLRSNSTLNISTAISTYGGTLIQNDGASIIGETITFENGIFEDTGNNILLSALFNPTTNAISLTGNDSLRAQPGTILQSVSISDLNNRISGQPIFTSAISLADASTTVTFAIQNRINQNISLSNGTLILEDDLRFADSTMLTGPGTINGNGFRVATGAKPFTQSTGLIWQDCSHLDVFACALDLDASFSFEGQCSINGHGNIIDLTSDGHLVITNDATLYLSDITIKSVRQDSFIFNNDASELRLCGDVYFEFIDSVTFSQGSIFVDGPTTFIIKDNTLTIDSSALMTIDGVTLWLDPAGTKADCLIEEVLFGSPKEDFLTLIANGTIKEMVSCIEINDIQEQIDNIVTDTCDIGISGCIFFSLGMLPAEGQARIFQFTSCYGPMASRPKLIFDPAVFGGGGVVTLPKNSRIIFTGDGRVELRDGVRFNYEGTSIADGPQPDWPELVLEEGAEMHLAANANVTIGGEGGKFTVRNCASVLLDLESRLIFGEVTTELLVTFDCASRMIINNSNALVTFHLGIFDVLFDNHSALDILLGTLEINTSNGLESPGIMRTLHFVDASSLRINKLGLTSGLLRFAPNDLDFFMDIDTRAGVIYAGGNMQFVSFGATPVDTIIQIQDRDIAIEQEVVEAFMQLGFAINQELNPQPPGASIIVLRGSLPNPALDGNLAALCPARNGSIVSLEFGDHDVRYDGDVITGKDMRGRTFRIFNCNASTRQTG